ncbi:MAG: CHAT domain-containing protein [Cyanobacteria bacterium J06649_4]
MAFGILLFRAIPLIFLTYGILPSVATPGGEAIKPASPPVSSYSSKASQAVIFEEAEALYEQGFEQYRVGQREDALALWQAALQKYRQIDEQIGIAKSLNSIGIIYRLQGSYVEALDYHQNSLELARQIEEGEIEAKALVGLAIVHQLQGRYPEALNYSQQSLEASQASGNRATESQALNTIGTIYRLQGRYAEALENFLHSLDIIRSINDSAGEAQTLNNIGYIYQFQGDYVGALDYFQQGLTLVNKIDDVAGRAQAFNNIANIYRAQKDYSAALNYYQQSLKISLSLGDPVSEAGTLTNIGNIHLSQGDFSEALNYYQQSLVIDQELGDLDKKADTLLNIGLAYRLQGDYDNALNYYQQSLVINRELADLPSEALTLAKVGYVFSLQERPTLAAILLKQSVSTYEDIRYSNRQLSQELQDSYARTIEGTYRLLADSLLQQDRVLEAQQVLDLLKVQELYAYLRGTPGKRGALSILKPEQEILDGYDELTTTAIELSQELESLRSIVEDERSSEQRQRISTLIKLQEDINQQFRSFASSRDVYALLDQLTPALQDATVRLSSLNRLQRELPDLNAALIYPLILEDRLEIVVMVPGSPPLRRTVENLTSVELNRTILDLRQALDSPNNDPFPAAQQLYDWLIRPIEDDLAQAGVTSLIYAPDGQLRYVPLAALHDGESWLIERYHLNNITAESLTEFDDVPASNPRVLAGAFTDASITHPVEIDGQTLSFAGLPFAGTELDNLEATRPDIKSFRDRNFTLEAVKGIMNEYEILHFATHAAFVNSNPEDSFILFGNGDRPNLLDIGNWTLSNVDLVVLSACETGLDGFGNGAEILGMGYQFQLSGAGAVMASLWSVSDRGTQDLMTRFYDHLGQGKAKAKALQQAQIGLINSSDEDIASAIRGGLAPAGTSQNLPESLKGFRHPHYWAPFILIGNGL